MKSDKNADTSEEDLRSPDRCGISVDLSAYNRGGFTRGRAGLFEIIWIVVQALLVSSFIPGSLHRVLLLRLFGASIGHHVTIKPGVYVKFPWRLEVGDNVWLGENVWIDNLEYVEVEANVCISQGAYLCTGSHDWSSGEFDLIVKPIRICQEAWLAAGTSVAPGVKVGQGAVLTLGSVAYGDLDPWTIYSGVPASRLKSRRIVQGSKSRSSSERKG